MTTLSEREVNVLKEALDDEHRAWATYDQVITDFGEVSPFANIRESESRHIGALNKLFTRYKLAIPKNHWPGKVDRYANLQVACTSGIAGEVLNAEMYDRLIAATVRPDILFVLLNLKDASQNRHLPAFQRCASGSGIACGATGYC